MCQHTISKNINNLIPSLVSLKCQTVVYTSMVLYCELWTCTTSMSVADDNHISVHMHLYASSIESS